MDDDQQFCLRWNNHQSTLVAVFDTLLENEKLVDCTLAAEGKFLNAHKVVLSACSPYFESLLSRHYDKHPILILKDVKFQELKAMMDYMYRGEVNISQDQLGALLKAAESLQIKGLSDNKKDEPVKRPAPAPAPPKSPQPQTQLPKVQGLTIEQRSRDDREGSMSPGPRKKKRMRRKSEEMDNHHDASNSSDAHSLPSQNIPSATTQLPANVKMNSDVPDTIETKQEILTRHKEEIGSQQSQVPMIKEKLETHTELMLEPKSEYVEEMNEDSIEDLTLDDDDLSNMEQMDDGAGPSHGGEGSSQQGFGHWQMGNQSQDEVFLAAQEAVGAHRDSQGYTRRDQEIAWRRRQQYQRPVPQRMAPVYQSKRDNAQLLVARRALNNAAPIKRPSENKPEYKSILKPQIIKPATVEAPPILKPSTKVEIRKASSIPKASPRQGCGLLTDSLSCIFTRRNNQQRKVPQKRVFYEDVPQIEPPKEKENELSDTESTYLPETKPVFVTPQKDCPEPPRISQPTPDISMEDWFTTKQRILGNVKHEENVCEPLKISESKCPEPPHIEVDPHGFDIEPPAHINKNVSPYVPTNSYERDEYEKYKSEKFKKEIALALLQKHYEKAQEAKKQREEAENVQKQSETHYSQVATYVPTQQQYEEDQDMEKYQVDRVTYYEQPSYQPTSLQEQTQQYVDVEYYGRYDTYDNQGNQVTEEHNYAPHDSKLDTENCPEAPQISSMPQEESPPEPPVISQERDDNPQYYQGYTKYDETNTFKEPIAQPVRASNQTMCHKCSFQTTNPKKLRDHLKFVHGEVVAVETTAKPKELFSRRDPKIQEAQEELFSRRGDFPSAQETEKKNRFKRRNTSAMVNIISSDIVVPARSETENRGEAGDTNVETHETGVLAAMEYFETTKDQPKKPRPYKRDPDQLDNDWI